VSANAPANAIVVSFMIMSFVDDRDKMTKRELCSDLGITSPSRFSHPPMVDPHESHDHAGRGETVAWEALYTLEQHPMGSMKIIE
jgi:hypothetical protein